MCILPVWQMGGIPASIRQVSPLSSHQILQQGVPKIRMGVSSSLVPCHSLIRPDGPKRVPFLITMHTGSHSIIYVTRLPYILFQALTTHGISKPGDLYSNLKFPLNASGFCYIPILAQLALILLWGPSFASPLFSLLISTS